MSINSIQKEGKRKLPSGTTAPGTHSPLAAAGRVGGVQLLGVPHPEGHFVGGGGHLLAVVARRRQRVGRLRAIAEEREEEQQQQRQHLHQLHQRVAGRGGDARLLLLLLLVLSLTLCAAKVGAVHAAAHAKRVAAKEPANRRVPGRWLEGGVSQASRRGKGNAESGTAATSTAAPAWQRPLSPSHMLNSSSGSISPSWLKKPPPPPRCMPPPPPPPSCPALPSRP